MSFLVDTNIFLRIVQKNHPLHETALKSLERLLEENIKIHFTSQNIAEFWNAATRPIEKNGLGYSAEFTFKEVEKIESLFNLLPDSPEIYSIWKKLVTKYQVLGIKVHDAKLVAMMVFYGLEKILTFDANDFNRYSEIKSVHPEALLK